jgi:ribosome-associated translation inhibitor RaiA
MRNDVQEVGVGLVRADAADASTSSDVFACSVSIRLRSGRQLDVASHAQHPYMAIDSAARQIARLRRRV